MLAFDRWDRPTAGEICDALTDVAAAFAVAGTRDRRAPNLRMRQPRWTPEIPTQVRAAGTRDLPETVTGRPATSFDPFETQ